MIIKRLTLEQSAERRNLGIHLRPRAITGMGNLYAGSGMTPDDVKFVMQASAAAYCPEHVQ